MEGLALLRAWAGDYDYDERFVQARLGEVRRLLDDERLTGHPGVIVERGATEAAYRQWSARYDEPNGLFDIDEPVLDEIIDQLPIGDALDAACGTGRLAARLVQRGHRVVGVDGSAEMLQQARRRLPDTDFVTGDLRRLPIADDFGRPGGHRVGADPRRRTGAGLRRVRPSAPTRRPAGRLRRSRRSGAAGLGGQGEGPDGQPQLATTHRHTVADFLRAALATGFSVRRFEEQPRPTAPEGPPQEPTDEIGSWPDWPWTLLGLVPEAARAAWNNPHMTVWHFQLG